MATYLQTEKDRETDRDKETERNGQTDEQIDGEGGGGNTPPQKP